MIKKIAIIIIFVIVGILGLAATKPDTFRVERSISINAPPEKIYQILNDFHNYSEWSPFEKLDPNLKRTYSGETAGKGAVYEWEGNSQAGAGRMEIVESVNPTKIKVDLDFSKPFKSNDNTVEYLMNTEGNSTKVTWAMSGPMPYISKVMCLFISMDKLLGKDFETGLANLKALAEK